MPVQCLFDVKEMSKSRFHEIDYQVMRHVFDVQNELGRLYHESIYQAEVSARCSSEGIVVVSEGEIVVSLDSFRKSYYVDALMNGGALYELKAVDNLDGNHESQLLNYMFLSGLKEGKLVNFASPSIQHRFVSTTVGFAARFAFSVEESEWDQNLKSSQRLSRIVKIILAEWGAYLDVNLYRDALVHFLGGEEKVCSPVEIIIGDRTAGQHTLPLLGEAFCLHVSSVVQHQNQYRKHLMRFLEHTNLNGIQWVNFNRNKIQLTTLKNSPVINRPVKK
ncbi:hypothetical protein PDESU_04749 [Pontiella desulfatans]|uniref:Uncharacterized protein n=1 Tax=Pontiella desulfatans TaxID=2750659 RepID=A0A6C2U8F4_PONDE|nr:GxxExxY protein [Pontiella desulfatans]VGO16159.1 hypothetical protein PDESU_04749 [Pontiella desulfatans]